MSRIAYNFIRTGTGYFIYMGGRCLGEVRRTLRGTVISEGYTDWEAASHDGTWIPGFKTRQAAADWLRKEDQT